MHDLNESEYEPFLTNRALTYYQDCILYANEMNRRFEISNRLQYHYLLNTIRKRKRFAKWIKPEQIDDLRIVMEYYSISRQKAEEYLIILSDKILKNSNFRCIVSLYTTGQTENAILKMNNNKIFKYIFIIITANYAIFKRVLGIYGG